MSHNFETFINKIILTLSKSFTGFGKINVKTNNHSTSIP